MRDEWARAEVLRIGEQGSGNTVEVATTLWNHVYRDYATDAPAPLDEGTLFRVFWEAHGDALARSWDDLNEAARVGIRRGVRAVRTALGERAAAEAPISVTALEALEGDLREAYALLLNCVDLEPGLPFALQAVADAQRHLAQMVAQPAAARTQEAGQ